MAKPDDRSDNVSKLQNAKENTLANINETEHYLDEHAAEIGTEEEQTLESKNARRRDAISFMKSEIQDESGK
jgi:small acid-soluble spore protein (thioredoxin-like protein)